ncbi:MAG TPA: phosphate ABC transporter permease subunit PstC [Thermoplasmata archaeon]|nr:phosphate ABC transporter permease subunit PstC [Thermoplasmata archaeon]
MTPRVSKWGDRIFLFLLLCATASVVLLVVLLVAGLFYGAGPAIHQLGLSYITGYYWNPEYGVYGLIPAIEGTLVTSAIALLIAVPLGLGAAIFLTQQAPAWLRAPVGQLIELLAAIPSVVYGFWGLIVLAPLMRNDVEPVLVKYLGWTGLFTSTPVGLDVLTASLVLSVMAIPTITAISRDSIAAVPRSQKEAALAIGATDWEVTRRAVVPYARSGIVAGAVLGLGRALGETMAVYFVIGNRTATFTSLIAQGQTIPSLIANVFLESDTPLERPALLYAGLVLLAITLAINIVARFVLSRSQVGRGAAAE